MNLALYSQALLRAFRDPIWALRRTRVHASRLRHAPLIFERLLRRLGLRTSPEIPPFESSTLDSYLAHKRFPADIEAFVRGYSRDGFVAVDLGEYARTLCDQAVAETEPFFADGQVSRVQDAWYGSPGVRKLATYPRIGQLLRAAYGREPFAFQTLNFRRGSEQPLHSDTIHFHSVPERFMCGVWIALEDIKPGSGPLIYRPGSHKLPVMSMRDAGVNKARPGAEDYDVWNRRFIEAIEATGLPAERAIIPKGWAFFWAANLAHGGSAIDDPQATRRSLVVHHYFEDCLYFTPMMSDVEAGDLFLRVPPDIRRDTLRWPTRNGRKANVGEDVVLDAKGRHSERQPHVV